VSLGQPISADEARDESIRESQELCRSARESYFPWYGEQTSREARRRLASDDLSSAERTKLKATLGLEMLKLDKTPEAIDLLEEAVREGRQAGIQPGEQLDLRINLALARLQAGEDENCLHDHNANRCIIPFQEDALHDLPEQARLAGDLLLEIAAEMPQALHIRWLLNLARMVSDDFPEGVPEGLRLPPTALQSELAFPRWIDRAPQLGVATVDLAGGAVMDDFDGDGLLDLISSTWDPCAGFKAFRNDGAGGFEDVASAWGLADHWGGLNLTHADFDNDGDLDLLLLRGAWMGGIGRIRNSLLRNDLSDGRGFVDVTHQAGLAAPAYPTQAAAWADYDLDGDLDVYIGNEDPDGWSFPSQLFRNNGDGTFTDTAASAGVTNLSFAKAVAWGDYDDDGDPDLYVSNSGPNRLFRNDGQGRFHDVAAELGVTEPEGRSFATWFFDFDNDGDLDLFVADYSAPVPAVTAVYFGRRALEYRPRLYRNEGGRFTEISTRAGLASPLLPMGANYGDLDTDGWPDIFLGTGEPGYEAVMPNVAYRNADGRQFVDVTFAAGFGQLQKGHGVAFGDLDNDGDQDLFHQLGGFFPGDAYANAVYENPTEGARWVVLRLEGRESNRFGVGARVEVRVREGDQTRSVHTLVGSGGSFGGSSLQQEIGLGRAEAIESLSIVWPASGTRQTFENVALDRFYRLTEGEAELVVLESPRLQLDANRRPGHHTSAPPTP
jgi:hypothetical protein